MNARWLWAAAAIALAACGNDGRGAASEATGPSAADVKPDPKLGLPIYPGAQLLSTSQAASDGGRNATFQLESTDTPQQLIGFYRDAAIRDGWVIKTDVNAGGLRMIGAEKGGEALTVQAAPRANGTGSSVTVVRNRR